MTVRGHKLGQTQNKVYIDLWGHKVMATSNDLVTYWGHKLGQTNQKGHRDLWGHKIGHRDL